MAEIKDLQKALERALNECIEKHYISRNVDRQTLIAKVIASIPKETIAEMNPAELNSPVMKKILKLSLVAAYQMVLQPNMKDKPNIGLLFKKEFTPKEKLELDKLLRKLNPKVDAEDRLSEKEILDNARDFPHSKDHKHHPNEHKPHEDSHAIQYTKQLIGGVDPTVTGGTQSLVTVVVGNANAAPDLNRALNQDALSADTDLKEEKEEKPYESPSPFSSAKRGPMPE